MTIQKQMRSPSPIDDPRAALEALFAPKPVPAPPPRSGARIVVAKRTDALDTDPRAAERQKRLLRLLAAEGHDDVTRLATRFLEAGFTLPYDQELQLKLLEHSDEERVRDAMHVLMALFEHESARQKTVLDARLRRLEENAEERATRDMATALRRRVATALLRG